MEDDGRDPPGFTIVELMFVVAIIAILAAVVVPTWVKSARKSKGSTEVSAMFAEFQTKESQYHSDNDAYRPTASACPAAPSSQAQDLSSAGCLADPDWVALRIAPPSSKVYCSYQVTVGAANTTPAPPAPFALPASPTASSWYYVLATCDFDSDGTFSEYFTSNLDTRIQTQNEGE